MAEGESDNTRLAYRAAMRYWAAWFGARYIFFLLRMKKAYEQSPAAVKKWLEEEYPVTAACAKLEGAEIHRPALAGSPAIRPRMPFTHH